MSSRHGGVIWNRDVLRGWFICLQNNMTTLLMDLPIVFAERLTTARPERSRGFSFGNDFITHETEADADGAFFGLIDPVPPHVHWHATRPSCCPR